MTAPRKTASKKPRTPTSPQEWKKAQAEPIELPSGNYMRVRRMSMPTLIATGKVPNGLLSVVQSTIDKGTGMEVAEEKMSELLGDNKEIQKMAQFMDDLICMVSIEPKVYPEPGNDEERLDHLLYADEVDQDDKSYLFAYVTGGTSDLEQFRLTNAANVAALSGRQDLELPPVAAAASD